MMLLATSPDRPLLDKICANLDGTVKIVEELTFSQAWEARADTLLCIEPIQQLGPPQVTSGSLAPLIKAAEASSVSRVIVVTHREDTDGDLRRLRQSGARYVIVRLPQVIDVEALRGKRVLVPRALEAAPLATTDDVVRVVTGVLRNPSVMGQTIDVAPSGIKALEAGGVKPRVVAPWRAKVGRWLGQPVLSM